MLGAGGGDFRVVRLDGGAGDHNVSASNVFGAVSFKGDCAEVGEAFGDRRALKVRAGNLVAEVQQDFGNTAHADAADAYEMDALDFGKHVLAASSKNSTQHSAI